MQSDKATNSGFTVLPGSGGSGSHAAENAPSGARGEVAAPTENVDSGNQTRVQDAHKPRRAWTPEDCAAREVWAPLFAAACAKHPRGDVGVAEILGVSKTHVQNLGSLESTATPDVRDLTRLRRRAPTVFAEFLRPFGEAFGAAPAPAPVNLLRDAHDTVIVASRLLAHVDLALKDEELDRREADGLLVIADELTQLADRLRAAAKVARS